jgi:hypothetical protein
MQLPSLSKKSLPQPQSCAHGTKPLYRTMTMGRGCSPGLVLRPFMLNLWRPVRWGAGRRRESRTVQHALENPSHLPLAADQQRRVSYPQSEDFGRWRSPYAVFSSRLD